MVVQQYTLIRGTWNPEHYRFDAVQVKAEKLAGNWRRRFTSRPLAT